MERVKHEMHMEILVCEKLQVRWIRFIIIQHIQRKHILVHTYIHTYIHTYVHVHTYIHTYICTHTYIHTYIHTYVHVHTYIHTYIHTYVHTCIHYHWWSVSCATQYVHTHATHTPHTTHTHTHTHTGEDELKSIFIVSSRSSWGLELGISTLLMQLLHIILF